MTTKTTLLQFAVGLTVSSHPLLAQEIDVRAACNPTNNEWVLPGDFATARERAEQEQRLLLIKGISFGVDDAGAKCATKGKW